MALVTIRRSPSVRTPKKTDDEEKQSENPDEDAGRISKSLNECYFAGAAVAGSERRPGRRRSPPRVHHPQPDIQHHLQDMFSLLRPEDTLKMAVKLESAHAGRTRYLVVVCHGEEAALLGIDCNEATTVGLVLRVLADTAIKLDGDGGFSVCVCSQQHIFKPVSVQAMWSALQTLHRASGRARALNHFAGGTSHAWCGYYDAHVGSDRSCLNEWHAMDCLESRRPPSPDSLRLKPHERNETERVIRCKLKEIMMSVDLDEVTSKVIRVRLEDDLDMDLAEYKSFIDQEMLTILGQMDAPTEIFEHVYLGSEWNASNLEELQRNGIRHILNVTREIDNFFPGMFDYLNIRVYDDEKTDLLKHWDNTFKYINKVRNEGSKVLVHCKMGISRSASVVIAYAMKAYNWNFDRALSHVKAKRNCIKPNTNFLSQLETYQGILDAMKNKEKLQRSKSETNLKSPKSASKTENKAVDTTPLVLALTGSYTGRPRSWSPDTKLASELLPPTSVSLENLAFETKHMLMPCANGSYSVSPNQIIRLKEEGSLSVKHIVNEIEAASLDRRDFSKRNQRLNFGSQNDPLSNQTRSSDASISAIIQSTDVVYKPLQLSPSKNSSHNKYSHSVTDVNKIHTWDPGEPPSNCDDKQNLSESDNIVKSDSGIVDIKTRVSDVLSYILDRNIECEERSQRDEGVPSRQSSWSSCDSAVVADLSRHSSWGASEQRARIAEPVGRPSEEAKPASDLGSISEHAEPRRARPQAQPDLSENVRRFNERCAMLNLACEADRLERVRVRGASTWSGRAGETWTRAALRRRRANCASQGDLPRALPAAPTGLVSNLKKEFEARSEPDSLRRSESRLRGRPPASPPEDLSVKVLVDRYDQTKLEVPEPVRVKPVEWTSKKSRLSAEGGSRSGGVGGSLRNSFCGAVRGSAERPPPVPTVLALAPADLPNGLLSTVMSKAQNKKQVQHGKTHPLTRLNRTSNRCSNPVYNTM